MSEGEKKRFGNFAEYAKARQANKEQMPLGGQGDQSRFMQQPFNSGVVGQQGMGLMGANPGGMPQQGLGGQGMQQRGMGGPGMGGMNNMGGPNMQMNRNAGGMGMQNMGLARGPQPGFGFDGQQGGQQGLGNQRMGQMQGGAGGMGRGGQMPVGGGQPGYSPSGEILAMLKGPGQGVNGQHGGVAGGMRQGGMMQQIGGYDGQGQGGGAFDPSDFPVLGGRGPGSSQIGHLQGEGGPGGVNPSQKEFSMEEDFPALPSGTTGSSGPNNSLMTGGAGAPGMMEQFQRMKLDMGGQQGQDAGNFPEGRQDRFGMLGLMSVIRMMDENLTTLALGTDLTHLGLNLNAADNLYETFQSPWADARSNRTPDYSLPRCYYISPPALKTAFFHKFSDMTLFYIFYHFLTRPSDASHQELRASLVKYAYQELSSRGWQYQNDANVWVTRVQSTNELKFFDMQSMELRPFSGQPAQGSLSQGSDGM